MRTVSTVLLFLFLYVPLAAQTWIGTVLGPSSNRLADVAVTLSSGGSTATDIQGNFTLTHSSALKSDHAGARMSSVMVSGHRMVLSLTRPSVVAIRLTGLDGRILHDISARRFDNGVHSLELPSFASSVKLLTVSINGIAQTCRFVGGTAAVNVADGGAVPITLGAVVALSDTIVFSKAGYRTVLKTVSPAGEDLGPVIMAAGVSSVALDKTEMTLSVGGSTGYLVATVLPDDAEEKSIVWTSSDSSVAVVSTTGAVTAVSPGNVIVRVTTTDGAKTATCLVTVNPPVAVAGLSLSKLSLNLYAGMSGGQIIATVTPVDAANKAVVWSSSDTAVVTVESNGSVTAKASGSAMVRATTVEGGFVASCLVTVSDPVHVSSVSISPATLTLYPGRASGVLSASVLPANATDKRVMWTSSNSAVASVNSAGVVAPLAVGNTTIVATSVDGGVVGECAVTVSPYMGADTANIVGLLGWEGSVYGIGSSFSLDTSRIADSGIVAASFSLPQDTTYSTSGMLVGYCDYSLLGVDTLYITYKASAPFMIELSEQGLNWVDSVGTYYSLTPSVLGTTKAIAIASFKRHTDWFENLSDCKNATTPLDLSKVTDIFFSPSGDVASAPVNASITISYLAFKGWSGNP